MHALAVFAQMVGYLLAKGVKSGHQADRAPVAILAAVAP